MSTINTKPMLISDIAIFLFFVILPPNKYLFAVDRLLNYIIFFFSSQSYTHDPTCNYRHPNLAQNNSAIFKKLVILNEV